MGRPKAIAVSTVIPSVPASDQDLFLMDIPTAARKLSTTVFAVRQLLRDGEIAYVVIGHKWLLSPGAIQDFIRRKEQDFLTGRAVVKNTTLHKVA